MTLLLYRDEFMSVSMPDDFTLEKAIEIQEEMAELSEMYQNSYGLSALTMGSDGSLEFNQQGLQKEKLEIIRYRVEDAIWKKYHIEEEHIKKALFLARLSQPKNLRASVTDDE